MAWTDKPTDAQVDALYNFLKWDAGLLKEKAEAAVDYVAKNTNREQASNELRRLYDLKSNKKLTRDNCMESEIWRGFKYDGPEFPSKEQITLIGAILRRHVPIAKAMIASYWLASNSTRKEVASEIERLKNLEDRNALTKEECFESRIWANCKETKE